MRAKLLHSVAWRLQSWSSQVELADEERETGSQALSHALSTDSEDPILYLEACSAISLDQNNELMLCVSTGVERAEQAISVHSFSS